eukprot:g5356.t1
MDDDEENFTYTGGYNSDGLFHGRGTIVYENGNTFYGRFCNGLKHGKGSLSFQDGHLNGCWQNDVLHGVAVYYSNDGTVLQNTYKDGEIVNGSYGIEWSRPGGKIIYEGQYNSSGERHGKGTLSFWSFPNEDDGEFAKVVLDGQLRGTFENHELHGENCEFVYPDSSKLIGTWDNGRMETAFFSKDTNNSISFCYDPPTNTRISSSPLLADPYEKNVVKVAPSTIDGAEEGLFMRQDVKAGQIVSFYSGIFVSCDEVEDRPDDFSQSANVINLDEDVAIDVPMKYAKIENYCATLGHKVNHSAENNCIYCHYFHPRFGNIKAIRAIQDLRKGDECFVDYGYFDEFPDWYTK